MDPSLTDFSYAAESYDAVVTIALATIAAGSDDGVQIAAALPDVTRGGEKCATSTGAPTARGRPAADIDYDGVSGPIEMSDAGDPTEATIGIFQYGAENNTYTRVDSLSGTI